MKKKKFFISVITPNYNGEKYLEQTILSVLKQTDKNFEYIVIDGNSKDKSKKILQKYKKKIDKLVIKEDNGIYDAVEKGIKMASGEIIIWINSDDLLHPNAIENVKKIFKAKPSLEWINGINGYIKYGYKFFGIPYVYPKFIFKFGFARHDIWGYLQQESVAFKKSLFLKVRGFGLKPTIAGDYKLWMKFSKFALLKTYYIKIGYFRSWPGQDSKTKKIEYQKNSNVYFKHLSFRYIRLFISLIILPYIVLKTVFLLNTYKLLK
ncbi:glycosyltransferase [Candidatus Pelagibacter sp. HIMB1509]|uniref:glycosyltransferase n=1 Tax=Candidatus Pelagibacter sp. HIMB1509 TaxID=3413339 RepID=UPI003F87E88B